MMEIEKLSPTKDLSSIKLIRGQKKNFGWEIKIVDDSDEMMMKRIKKINEELIKSFDNLNGTGG